MDTGECVFVWHNVRLGRCVVNVFKAYVCITTKKNLITKLLYLILFSDLFVRKLMSCMLVSQAGHPFQQRCAHSAYSHARLKQECPSFLLLLDCVWQLWRQFPFALEFSEALLLRLAQEVYASNYATFLCNSEQERWAQVTLIWHSLYTTIHKFK